VGRREFFNSIPARAEVLRARIPLRGRRGALSGVGVLTMFQQLFKKILPRASHRDIRKSRLSPSDRRAYELGEKFAANMARQIEEYIKKRSDNIKGNYIAILRQHLDKALHQELHSPLLVARVELEVFMENVDGACQKLIEETVGAANAE
jgi:hypothetical protein